MGRQTKVTESFSVKKSAGLNLKVTVKRRVFDDENAGNENKPCTSFAPPVGALDTVDRFQEAKNALHVARPSTLVARKEEYEEIYSWLDSLLGRKVPGSMYISGAPGTGKTAVVLHAIHKWKDAHSTEGKNGPLFPVFDLQINCMNVNSPAEIYEKIGEVLKVGKKEGSAKEVIQTKLIRTSTSSTSKMLVLVLDEMDQLLKGRGTEVLHDLFETARIPESRLIVIGIANALDLATRHFPQLHQVSSPRSPLPATPTLSKRSLKPRPRSSAKLSSESPTANDASISPMKIINFSPYQREDIEKILEARLTQIGSDLFDLTSIKFVAAKVAATTGDMRKALNACKSALDAVEKQQRKALKSTADDGFNFSSPKKFCGIREKISVATCAKAFTPLTDEGPLPLQQMIILTTLLRLFRNAPHSKTPKLDGVSAPIPMNQLYDEYRKICAVKGFSWIDRSEISSVCGMLQDRSLVTVVENVGGGAKRGPKKFSSFNITNAASKTGFQFNLNAVDKIVMQSDMKNIVVE